MRQNGRASCYLPLAADDGATYDEVHEIDLSKIRPLAACPHSPDNVKPIGALAGLRVDQVCIGSCTNSSLHDLLLVAAILRGRKVSPHVSLSVSPGSRQVLTQLSECGALADILSSGARLLECACGPCIGMGNSPCSAGVSLRTFNRNFEGRSGTADARVYLVSPAVAAVAAIFGEITDPAVLGEPPRIGETEKFTVNDNMIDLPDFSGEVEKGPNIKPVPIGIPVPERLAETVLLKVGDNITTDHIMPAGSAILPYRSNVPYLSRFCFSVCDKDFARRAAEAGHGVIVGGENYGQGSSREHAALVPLYLGVRAVIAKSFARIHMANLINAGILPLTFADAGDYDLLAQGDEIRIDGMRAAVAEGDQVLAVCRGGSVRLSLSLSQRQRAILLAGGLLNYTKEQTHKKEQIK